MVAYILAPNKHHVTCNHHAGLTMNLLAWVWGMGLRLLAYTQCECWHLHKLPDCNLLPPEVFFHNPAASISASGNGLGGLFGLAVTFQKNKTKKNMSSEKLPKRLLHNFKSCILVPGIEQNRISLTFPDSDALWGQWDMTSPIAIMACFPFAIETLYGPALDFCYVSNWTTDI